MAAATQRATRASPAGRYALAAGAALVAAGAIGLLFDAGFLGAGSGQVALHLATGLLGLAAARAWARDYALGIGLLYALIGVAGLVAGDGADLAGALHVTTAASVLALLLGLVGLGAGAATPPGPQPGRIERRTSSARARRPPG